MYKLDNSAPLVPTLYTERLILRKVEDYDIDLLTPISYYDGRHAACREEALQILYKIYDDCFRGDSMHWGIALKETDEIIGTCGFYRGLCNSCGEVGYVLREERRGKGFVTEAVNAVIKYGFEIMRLNAICAYIEPANIPSINVITRLRFKDIPSDKEGFRKFEKVASV